MLLDKLLSLFIYPLGTSLLLGCIGIVLWFLRQKRSAMLCTIISLGWLWLWSSPITTEIITRTLEEKFTCLNTQTMPDADVIVVFGGVMSPAQSRQHYPHLCEGADRVWHAARLYHAGRAPKILLSGGRYAWQPHYPSEALTMALFLKDLGVPHDAIILEEKSCNTYENAVYSAELMEQKHMKRALLVTSALHMFRSLSTTQKTGIDVIPAPTDFEEFDPLPKMMRYLPNAHALHVSTKALHEWVGILVYRWRGWM